MENKNLTVRCEGLRILLRGPFPPPYGGIATLIASILPGLKACGAEDIVVLDYGKINSVEKVKEGIIYRYNLKRQLWKIMLPQNWFTFFQVANTLKGNQIPFRQLMRETIKTILATKIAKRHSSKVVNFYQSHEAIEMLVCKKKWGTSRSIILNIYGEIYDNFDIIEPRKELFRKMVEMPAAVVASSEHCGRSFKKIGVERHIDVIYVGVDMERFDDKQHVLRNKYRQELGISDNTTVVLYMGRFIEEMGLDSMIDIVPSLIAEKGNELKLIFAGAKGPLCDAAFECKKKYPDHVIVMNNVPFALQPSLYSAADIVVTPSRAQHACMGVTIKEAMAASRPVIGSDSGGIPEAIIHAETGLIIPLLSDGDVDSEAFKQAILSLMGQKEKCAAMGKAGRQRAHDLFSEVTTINRSAKIFMNGLSNG